MKHLLPTLLLHLVLMGCAGAPFVEVHLAAQLDGLSDQLLDSDARWTGQNPQFHMRAGLEWDNLECGVWHYSHLLQGRPFNDDPEMYANYVYCGKRWGGQ